MTATAGRPPAKTAIVSGGRTTGDVDRGTTTTVLRFRFKVSDETMTHGLLFLISLPRVGSRSAHHTSPRSRFNPRLFNRVAESLPIVYQSIQLRVGIHCIARCGECLFLLAKPAPDRIGHIMRPPRRRNRPQKWGQHLVGNRKRDLPHCHTAILPELCSTLSTFATPRNCRRSAG